MLLGPHFDSVVFIMASKQDNLRARVYKFFTLHADQKKAFTVAHFKEEGISSSTIYDILKRQSNGISAQRKFGSGGSNKCIKGAALKRLETMFKNKCGVSVRSAARKFDVSKSCIHKVVKTSLKLKYRKKTKIPKRSMDQIQLAKVKCGRLLRKFHDKKFILDDESYFTLGHSSINGNDGFYTNDISKVDPDVKFIKKSKFEQKVLVWVAIGPNGISRAFIRKSGYAINADRYLNECIRKRLIPYIKSNYIPGEFIFWPDQASAHYAKIVLAFLTSENIDFIQKSDNPANVPEIRVIEDFWAYLKAQVYSKGWAAKNLDQLIARIKYCLKNIDKNFVQALCGRTMKRIDHVRRHGVIESV